MNAERGDLMECKYELSYLCMCRFIKTKANVVKWLRVLGLLSAGLSSTLKWLRVLGYYEGTWVRVL